MALTQRLELRQSHALVMTPQLMQAIKLLQLSNLDLAAYVEGELERNPLLERPGEGDGAADAADPEVSSEPAEADWMEPAAHRDGDAAADHAALDVEDVPAADADAALSGGNGERAMGYSDWATTGAGGRDNSDYNLEAFVSVETTLADHLAGQLALSIADPARRMIGQYLIDLIDEAGYLNGELAAVAEKLGAPLGEVESVLAILQGFDPPGVCARNLTECLAIQLKEHNRLDPAMQALLGHLDLLAKRDRAALRRICGVGEEDLTEMIAEVRKLNPKPGLAFGSTQVQPIVPDVFVRPGPSGGFTIELNSDTLPKVLVNQT